MSFASQLQHVSLLKRRGRLGNLRTSFSTRSFSFLHCTQNPELKTSQFSLRHIDQTRRFSDSWFFISHHTQNRKLGVGNQVSKSDFSISHCTQNRKLGVEHLGIFSKVHPKNDFVHCPRRTGCDIWNGANVEQFS